jgi:ABC-type polysaccharide/polyol phosphate transport system ATPase subunit/SAM-dependent methyltransferase
MSLVLETRQLSKRFVLRHNARDVKSRALGLLRAGERARREEFWALRGVSIRIAAGESVGLVGRNGSGKSTLLKVIAGIHRPTGGHMLVRRGLRISSMIELGTGFHPELTGQENVLLNTSIHGLTRPEALAIYERVVAYSGLRHFMDVPIKNYSSGMHMRLGFAIAANLDPDVLLLDEIFAVGDEEFQRQCMGTLSGFLEAGKTILFVSHSAAAVQAICRRVCVLERGQLRFDGDVDSGLTEYRRLNAASPHQVLGTNLEPGDEALDADVSHRSGETANAEQAWHRLATGGRWDEEGGWVFDFLRARGLRPDHYVLDMGCGSLAAAARLLPFMEQSHYWGFEKNVELFVAGVQIELPRTGVRPERGHFLVNDDFDLSSAPHAFDLAIASSLLRRLPLNGVARCFASVIRKLAPGGTFFVAWAEPGADPFAPHVQRDGTTTLGDRPPYHYDFGVLARLAEIAGGRAERLPDQSHPRGDSIMAITRNREIGESGNRGIGSK